MRELPLRDDRAQHRGGRGARWQVMVMQLYGVWLGHDNIYIFFKTQGSSKKWRLSAAVAGGA